MPNWRDTLEARQAGEVAGFIGTDEPVEDFVDRNASDLANQEHEQANYVPVAPTSTIEGLVSGSDAGTASKASLSPIDPERPTEPTEPAPTRTPSSKKKSPAKKSTTAKKKA